jgi:hypothetical protein
MVRAKAITPVSLDTFLIKMMLYGPPGVGKTVLAGTSPNCLFLAADPGTESAAVQGSKAAKWDITDYNDLTEAYEWLRHENPGEPNPFEWVWLDHVTYFQELGLDQIMEDLHAAKPHRETWAPDKGEFGQNMNRLSLLVRNLKRLPLNFGMIAHAMEWEDPQTGQTHYWPQIQGKGMPSKFCGYTGIVGYMSVVVKEKKQVRRLRTQKNATHIAKDRFHALPSVMTDPTMPKIIELVEGVLPSGKLGVPPPKTASGSKSRKATTTRRNS